MGLFASSTAAGTPNPYDMGGAEQGVSPEIQARLDASLAAWYASRDKIVQELVPNLQAAVANLNNWQRAIQQLIDIAHAVLPMTGIGSGQSENSIQELSAAAGNISQLGATVQNVMNQVPSLVRMVNTLIPRKA